MDETKMQLLDWLDDLCVRFIVNLPQEELESVERICFQVEEAQWFYEDFVRPLDPALPSLTLKEFCLRIFQHCPLFDQYSQDHHIAAFSNFLAYKTRVPVRGAIMLNDAMDEVVLVKGWKKSANWSFPRGKINKDEPDLDCAVREVYEETGFDIGAAGLVLPEPHMKYIEVTMREQHMRLYVFRGVSKGTNFQPRTRKEISKIAWYKLANLPGWRKKKQQQHQHQNQQQHIDAEETVSANKLYMVAPFLPQLKKWINEQRKHDSRQAAGLGYESVASATDNNVHNGVGAEAGFGGSSNINKMNELLGGPGILEYAQPTPDAATELKRLLSVGEPVGTASQTGNAASAKPPNLLALLQSSAKESASKATPRSAIHPSLLEQHQQAPHYAAAQHRKNELGVLSNQQWPSNATSGFRGVAGGTGGMAFKTPAMQATPHGYDHEAAHSTHQSQQMPPATAWNDARQVSALQRNIATVQPAPQRPAPYQRTGDPQFAHSEQDQAAHIPSVPSAAQLPAPKLTGQKQKLLDAFKGSPHGSPASLPLQAQSETRRPSANARTLVPASIPPSRPQSKASGSVPAAAHEMPSTTKGEAFHAASRDVSTTAGVGMPLTPTMPDERSVKAPHQAKTAGHANTLLSLFKASSPGANATDPATASQQSNRVGPAELPAFPSPQAAAAVAQRQESSPTSEATKVLSILQRPKPAGHAEGEEKHDIGGGSRPAERTEGTKRTGRTGRTEQASARSDGSRNKTKASVEATNERRATPVQILRRPLAGGQEASPERGASKGTPRPQTPAQSQSAVGKAFQPQILRRPQQQSPKAAAEGSSPLRVWPDKQSSIDMEQRQNLLSLFGQAKPRAAQHPSGSLESASNNTLPNAWAGVSAVGSPTYASGVVAKGQHGGAAGTWTPKRQDSAPQTPLSSGDRGFLVSYLEGVVKGGK